MAKISISDLYSTSIEQISDRSATRKVIGGFNFSPPVPDDTPPPYNDVPDPDGDRIRLRIPGRTIPYSN